MKNIWATKWKKCFIWFSSYFSFIALAIVGGYAIIKSEDAELKKTTKNAFIVTLIFACVSGFLTIFYNLGGLSDNFLSSAAYDFYQIFTKLINVIKIVVFAIFIVMELVKKDNEQTEKDIKE